MRQRSLVPSRSCRVAAFGSVSTLLVVFWAAPSVVSGHWLVPKWKWTAKRLRLVHAEPSTSP